VQSPNIEGHFLAGLHAVCCTFPFFRKRSAFVDGESGRNYPNASQSDSNTGFTAGFLIIVARKITAIQPRHGTLHEMIPPGFAASIPLSSIAPRRTNDSSLTTAPIGIDAPP